jgi:hypothetical protein
MKGVGSIICACSSPFRVWRHCRRRPLRHATSGARRATPELWRHVLLLRPRRALPVCLKQLVRTYRIRRMARINRCGFLLMALINVVQVKLGQLGCGAGGSSAIMPLVPPPWHHAHLHRKLLRRLHPVGA